MPSTLNSVDVLSTTTIKPATPLDDRIDLTPLALSMLTTHYIQMCIILTTPRSSSVDVPRLMVDRLKSSLSTTLCHFYPLAGRLATEKGPNDVGTAVYIEFHGQGAEFVHAIDEGVSVEDAIAAEEGSPAFHKYTPLNGAVNHDGHTLPLLAVQVTELRDGIFIGLSCNHMVVDGTSCTHFINSWAEISCRGGGDDRISISRPPIIKRWHAEKTTLVVLPYEHHSEFVERFTMPEPIYARSFLFPVASLKQLKAKVNSEAMLVSGTVWTISAFQALTALVWRAIARSYHLPPDFVTTCVVVANMRQRLNPPLSDDHLGCYIHDIAVAVSAGELLANDLGWSSSKLHDAITGLGHTATMQEYNRSAAGPELVRLSSLQRGTVAMVNSPRFDIYDGVDFGWGKPVAVHEIGNCTAGTVAMKRGREEAGSIEVEVFLPSAAVAELEVDKELIAAMKE